MTLDIAIANYWYVIQASDRRLTLNGKPWDENANKCVIFGCRDAMLSITYTGLAYIGELPTDVWISETLANNNLQFRDMGFSVDTLCRAATRAFTEDIPPVDRPTEHTFLIAGWQWKGNRIRSYIWWVTNRDVSVRAPATVPTFVKGYLRGRREARVGEGKGGCMAGARAAVDLSAWRDLSSAIRGERDANRLVEKMISVIRASSEHPRFGHLVGKNVMVVILPRPGAGDIRCEYYPAKSSPVAFTPAIVTANVYSPSLELIGAGMTISAGSRTYSLGGTSDPHPSGIVWGFRPQPIRPRPKS